MRVFRQLTICWVAGLCLFLYSSTTQGGSKSAQLAVTATVAVKTDGKILHNPSELIITHHDLKEGRATVENGTVVSVSNNNPNGYIIAVQSQPVDFVTSVTVISNGSSFHLLPGGSVEVHLPYRGLTPHTQHLSYRFQLAAGAKATRHPWPLVIRVLPFT